MIINKPAEKFEGNVVYAYSIKEYPYSTEETNEDMWENRKFKTLADFLKLTSQEVLDEIKEDMGAHRVWIGSISFSAKSEDNETKMRIAMFDNEKVQSWVTTRVNNEDIDNRVLENIQKVKQIIDNTLEGYPTKF
ncbi:hypothetical protein [Bacillus toyonensis]|uniref:hypothetical protein n=1 Tax=Bacillus toyonensis TaxID=155322 RepID=UPI002E218E28|nr:hypothetical protein [Bacillus toyonensis]